MNYNLIKICFLALLLISCGEKKEEPKTPEPTTPVIAKPTVELEKADFADLKNWNNDDVTMAVRAFEKSCKKIAASKSEFLGSSEIKVPTKAYQEACRQLKKANPADYKTFFSTHFTPYLVKYDGSATGKFTSYYESALNASYQKTDKYKFPIYGRPDDMIEFNLQDFDNSLPNRRFVGRIHDKKLIPYFTRAEINSKKINAPVILWSDNYVDIYVMQIQGSAVATLEDGTKVRVGYSESNGREFKGIGSILLQKGLLKPGEASMGNIKKWLKNNIDSSVAHMDENQRYVFHRLINSDGPIGAQGVSLTAGRSLAVDKSFVPLGSLLWLETTGPNREKIEKLVIAQDIGGAIKGAVRGDYFWGSGGDEILDLAGKMHASGQYYILIPNPIEVK